MRRTNYPLVVAYIVFILAVLLLAWWIAGDYYKPYPPATPTASPGYWPTRITATIVPSATPTKVVHTPIQPTIGYTATPTVLITIENTPTPENTSTSQPAITATPIPVVYPAQITKEYACEMWLFRGVKVFHYIRCMFIEPRQKISPIRTEEPFTGSPIFVP